MKLKTVSSGLVTAIVGLGVSDISISGDKIWYLRDGGDTLHSYSSVDKFAKKCKRWISSRGYTIDIFYEENNGAVCLKVDGESFSSDNEDEVAIMAAEWVYENRFKA